MPQGDGSEQKCFEMWKQNFPLKKMIRESTAKRETVRQWVRAWERGLHKRWDVVIED